MVANIAEAETLNRLTALKLAIAALQKAVDVDEHLRTKRGKLMEEGCFLHPSRKPLSVVVGEQANFLDEFDNCESGYCFT